MARERNEHCRICGVEKTEENTYMRVGGLYFQSLCKKCMSLDAAERYVKKMSPERKKAALKKHKKHIAAIEAQEKQAN